jgi:hypothetical protein
MVVWSAPLLRIPTSGATASTNSFLFIDFLVSVVTYASLDMRQKAEVMLVGYRPRLNRIKPDVVPCVAKKSDSYPFETYVSVSADSQMFCTAPILSVVR